MYCPQCSQEQVSEEMRFCSRCGFPLAIVSQLVRNGGALEGFDPEAKGQLSPRQKGIRWGPCY
jgi:predicted amidophosphoribosyltransferase